MTIDKVSYTRENEKGNKISGSAHVGNDGISAKGGVETYNQQTNKAKVRAIETSYSKKDYKNIEGSIDGKYKNGKFEGNVGGSYANGQKHTGKIGDVTATVGKEDKISGKAGLEVSRNNVKGSMEGKNQLHIMEVYKLEMLK